MKRILLLFFFLSLSGGVLRAQDLRAETSQQADTVLVEQNILSAMGSGVTVNQPLSLQSAFDRHVSANAARKVTGYRIRVYFDSGQNARGRSESVARSVTAAFPGIGVYRTFDSPNFKVSVGDFRTKDDALKVYHALKASYPTAIILKETINDPK